MESPDASATGVSILPTSGLGFSAYDSAEAYSAYVRRGSDGLFETDLIVNGIHCGGCVRTIEQGLRKAGATAAAVNLGTHRASVLWDEHQVRLGGLLESLERLGYPARPYDPATQETMNIHARRWALMRLGVAGFGAMNSMLYSVGLYAGYFYGMDTEWRRLFQGVTAWIALPVVLFSGWPFLKGAWAGLRSRQIAMDGLISLGLLSALIYSWVVFLGFPGGETYFESVTMGVFVLLIGRALETLVRARMGSVTESLLGHHVRWATRLEPKGDRVEERIVSVAELLRGDRVRVRVGEAFPVDGALLSGETEVNESALTGESRPRFVMETGTVLAGTLNTGNAVIVEAQNVGTESVLGKIARLVDRAQQTKAPIQRVADRIAGQFAPAVLALAAGTLAYWIFVATSRPPQPAWAIAITVLIIACPCGLGLATPMAVFAANVLAAQRGILIKGGEALERAAKVTDVVMDKTGTLTTGGMRIERVVETGSLSRALWLGMAAAVEQQVMHPVAEAIAAEWRTLRGNRPDLVANGVQVRAGRGAQGIVADQRVLVGSGRLMTEHGVGLPHLPPRPNDPADGTSVYVAIDDQVQGALILSDPVRSDAIETVAKLARLGLRLHVFSGDTVSNVRAVGERLGIADARGAMLPKDKLEAIAALQREGCVVAMVGDGLNDGPSLVQADVGIAVANGTDLALESADVLLLRPRLDGVLETLALAKRAYAVIRQNLAISVAYNLCAIPLAMLGWVIPLAAAVSMALSSLLVVGNSLRLKLFRASVSVPVSSPPRVQQSDQAPI